MKVLKHVLGILSTIVSISCINNIGNQHLSGKEALDGSNQHLLGKWVLIDKGISTDGGNNFERYPIDDGEVLILLEDGVALYPDRVLGVNLETAQWRVYSNGDSLEIDDKEQEYTGIHDNYRISKMYNQSKDGETHEIMELTLTSKNSSMMFGGAETIILMMRYEKENGWTPKQLKQNKESNSEQSNISLQEKSQEKELSQEEEPQMTRAEVFQKVAQAMQLTSQGMFGIKMNDPIDVAIGKAVNGAKPKDYLWISSWVEWQQEVDWETIVYRLYPTGPIAVEDQETGEAKWSSDVAFDLVASIQKLYDEDEKKELISFLSEEVANFGPRQTDRNDDSELTQFYRIDNRDVYVGIGPGEVNVHYFNCK